LLENCETIKDKSKSLPSFVKSNTKRKLRPLSPKKTTKTKGGIKLNKSKKKSAATSIVKAVSLDLGDNGDEADKEPKLKYEDLIVFIVDSHEDFMNAKIVYETLVEDALNILEIAAKFRDADLKNTLWDYHIEDKSDNTERAITIELNQLKNTLIKKDKENEKLPAIRKLCKDWYLFGTKKFAASADDSGAVVVKVGGGFQSLP
jgi:co-chaperonin GroES (HSP10)